MGPQAQSPAPPPGFPDCGRGSTRLARTSRARTKELVPVAVQPHAAVKRGAWTSDPSLLLRQSTDPTTLLAMAAILVMQKARRKYRTTLAELLDDLLAQNLSDETVLRHVVEMPFGRKKVDASGVLVAAVQLCREHCLRRTFWGEKAADITELARNEMLSIDAALQELNASADGEMGNK